MPVVMRQSNVVRRLEVVGQLFTSAKISAKHDWLQDLTSFYSHLCNQSQQLCSSSKMLLEDQRFLHEDLERLESAVSDRIAEDPRHVCALEFKDVPC